MGDLALTSTSLPVRALLFRLRVGSRRTLRNCSWQLDGDGTAAPLPSVREWRVRSCGEVRRSQQSAERAAAHELCGH